jgi:hypothetical protein
MLGCVLRCGQYDLVGERRIRTCTAPTGKDVWCGALVTSEKAQALNAPHESAVLARRVNVQQPPSLTSRAGFDLSTPAQIHAQLPVPSNARPVLYSCSFFLLVVFLHSHGVFQI